MRTIGVDTGGTFTDFVFWEDGRLRLLKVASTPDAPEQAVLHGIRYWLNEGVPFRLLHGTTVGTNAILEGKGARTAFLTTRGFRDMLHIGRQERQELYSLCPRPRPCLAERALCAEVAERIAYDGTVLYPLHTEELERLIRRWKRAGVEAVAVCLLFSYVNPSHERALKAILERHFAVSISSEVAPEFREYERASTTFLNATLTPIMGRYLERLQASVGALGAEPILLSGSSGGLMSLPRARAYPLGTVLSGPAAGVMGAWALARQAGIPRALTLDVGGTSSDMALIDHEPLRATLGEIGGMPMRMPRLDIHTLGAGGGSLAYLDPAGGLRVGPQSAGADPGPAVYGKSLQPTLTDAHFVLGHLRPETFGFGQIALEPERAWRAIEPLAQALGLSIPETAEAIVEQARARIARGLRTLSAGRGYDPAQFTLVVFGGAGALHACALARLLQIPQWLVPPYPGVLSAYGLLWMEILHEAARTVLRELPDRTDPPLERVLIDLREECESVMREAGVPIGSFELHPYADLRYTGQSHEITVPLSMARLSQTKAEFERLHQARYGFTLSGRAVELVNMRLRAVALQPKPAGATWEPPADWLPPNLPSTATLILNGQTLEAPVIPRHALAPDEVVPAPALVVQPDATVLIEPGWHVQVCRRTGSLIGRWQGGQ